MLTKRQADEFDNLLTLLLHHIDEENKQVAKDYVRIITDLVRARTEVKGTGE